jgi:hypothetical protein
MPDFAASVAALKRVLNKTAAAVTAGTRAPDQADTDNADREKAEWLQPS